MGVHVSEADGERAAGPSRPGPQMPPRLALRWQEQPDAVARVAGLLLLVATVAAYSNSLAVPFLFDDRVDIVENVSIRRLWPPWRAFLADSPADGPLRSRPVSNLSLAVNYATGQLDTLHYHLTNLAIHATAGLLLFGLVRKTLLLPKLKDRYVAVATPLAFAIAGCWTLHPLQTEAVTYVIQRYESLMGMFYLLALYSVVQSESTVNGRRWAVATVLACLAALGCKEVAVSLPLMILLYDRAFLSGSFRQAWRRRWGMYLGLAGCWMAFGALLCFSGGRGRWAGYQLPISWFDYAKSQFGVILHYLRLSFWPHPLVFDYRWPVADGLDQILPGMLVVGGLLAATVWALVRRPMWGTVGAMFFLVLAPTSSVMPIADLAFEHRMYLPLASVVVIAVVSAYELLARWFARRQTPARAQTVVQAALVLVALGALGTATYARNRVYESGWSLWSDVLGKMPGNGRAFLNLATILHGQGKAEEALPLFHRAIELCSFMPNAHLSLGCYLERQGLIDEAIREYREEIRLHPRSAEALSNLGTLLAQRGQTAEAMALCRRAVEYGPGLAEAHNNLANLLVAEGKIDEAVVHYQLALEMTPQNASLHGNLGDAWRRAGKIDEAIAQYRTALTLDPQSAEACAGLAMALSLQAKTDEAIVQYQTAIELKPDYLEAYNNLAVLLAKQGKVDEAITLWRKMLHINPSLAQVHWVLGMALESRQKVAEAVAHWREVVRLQPDYVPALSRLAWILATCPQDAVRRGDEAVRWAEAAARLSGGPSPELLDTLAAAQAEAGRFAEAAKTAEQALKLASDRGDKVLADSLRGRLAGYRAGTPFRDPPTSGHPAKPATAGKP